MDAMNDTPETLSPEDVNRLAQDPSPENRAAIADRLARQYEPSMAPAERNLAETIFRALLRDVEVRVRAALAESLKFNPAVPRDVAVALARDVAEVATPILRHSEVLPDEDLLQIIAEASVEHRVAVAGREDVSETIADALVDAGETDVVVALLANENAELSETTLADVIDAFGDDERVADPMARRKWLPLSISERLVTLVSDRLRGFLVAHHELPEDTASDLVRESRDRATMSLIGGEASEPDVTAMVQQLHENGRLTPTIILHAVCLGDGVFFEAAMARLCGISLVNAHKLIDDPGEKGLRAICARAGVPDHMQPIIHAALGVARETDYDGRGGDRQRFVARMAERVLTACGDTIEGPSLDYLMRHLRVDAISVAGPTRLAEVYAIDG